MTTARVARRNAAAVVVAVLLLACAAVVARPATGRATGTTQRQFVRMLKRSPMDRMLSGPARTDLRLILGARRGSGSGPVPPRAARQWPRRVAAAPANVRVNDPSGDGAGDPDMTTQNEVSLAVSGQNVVAGYNDDGTSPRPGFGWISPATNFSGYSWSDDGGTTWFDDQLPNASPRINSGDPVIVADRAGHFFYADLSLEYGSGRVDVAVGRSDDGGETFGAPKLVARRKFTVSDKPWMVVGPDPANPSADVVYVGWEENFFNPRTHTLGSRIVVSASRDLGQTWSIPVTVRSQPFAARGVLGFLNGTSLAVDPDTGRLYVAWEQFLEPPGGRGKFPLRREWIASSDDGAASFHGAHVAATVNAIGVILQSCGNALRFGAGRLIRVTEFPSLGVGPGGEVLMAFDTTGGSGVSEVDVASSEDGGATWTVTSVTDPPQAFMPALSADDTGASVVYYRRVPGQQLRTELATSPDGTTWTTQDLSDATFPVPITYPNFDPLPAPCYMGDYVGAVRTGGVTYGAWGDNRDTVTNSFWPGARPDPDVYFAKI